ncbi:MAG: YgfZ/GcvT domain-containing protein, partial [Bryobacteraceae bacterium]
SSNRTDMNDLAYKALKEGAAWIDLTGRGKIRMRGEDRVRLLHAMTTNHIEQLTPGTGCYAFFLNAQGRILSDVNVFCLPEYLLLDTEPEAAKRVYEHLDKYIIADDVTLEDATEEMVTLSVEGPDAEQILKDLGAPIPAATSGITEWGAALIAGVSRTGAPGYFVFLPQDDEEDLITRLEAAGVVGADTEEVDAVRLENGKTIYGIDIYESNIPQETQQMHALHFSKGCYLGQEIVERVRSRGHVNKKLASLEIESEEPVMSGTKVQSGGKDAGEITSSAYSPERSKVVALAIVRAEALKSDAPLTVAGAPACVPKTELPIPSSRC